MGLFAPLNPIEVSRRAEELWKMVNTARTVVCEFWNHTDFVLRLDSEGHDGGGFKEPPELEVPPQTVLLFSSQSSSGSVFTGTEGHVKYEIGDHRTQVRLRWNNPYAGKNSCSARVEGEKMVAFEANRVCGNGNDAKMKYELRVLYPPDEVRTPNYKLVRSEGRALSPNEDWFSADPDRGGNRFPFPAVALHSWWSPSREDNWATTEHAGGPGKRLDPDYTWHRLEGYILDPQRPIPSGVDVSPLYAWWSPSRGDNWATTNPQYTMPPRDKIEPDYRGPRLLGYLLQRAPAELSGNTVQVWSWYNPIRADNHITSEPGPLQHGIS